MKSEPQQEHQWLSKLVGEWTWEAEATMAPDQPAHKVQATEVVRSLGGLWVLCESHHGTTPEGDPSTTIMTLGYDPLRKRYVGTFIGSMMSYMWVYEGVLDATGNKLTLDTVGPTFDGTGKMAQYKDVIEFKSPDHRVLTSQTLTPDKGWQQFMTAHYRRKA
jgi:hypothetical protein